MIFRTALSPAPSQFPATPSDDTARKLRWVRLALLCVAVLVIASSAGCNAPEDEPSASTAVTDTVQSNAELADIYEADQAGRQSIHEKLGDQQALRELVLNDSLRRVRVQQILDAGDARTADDYYHAAMVFQHGGDTTAYRKAHELAEQAVALDSTHKSAKWLTAASWDRYLVEKGEPQWYGTQYTKVDGAWRLRPVDTTKVTDAERVALGVPTLAEARAQADSMNARP